MLGDGKDWLELTGCVTQAVVMQYKVQGQLVGGSIDRIRASEFLMSSCVTLALSAISDPIWHGTKATYFGPEVGTYCGSSRLSKIGVRALEDHWKNQVLPSDGWRGTPKAAEFLVSSLVGLERAVGTVAWAVGPLTHTNRNLMSTLQRL